MKVDFAVIGAGIAGLGAAAEVGGLGKTVVLERESSVGYHASGRSAAMFVPDYGNDIVCALNHASSDALQAAGVLKMRPMLMLARAEDKDQLNEEARDLGLEAISLREAETMLPIFDPQVVRYAASRADTYDLDTDLLMQEFTRKAQAAGAQTWTSADVQAITQNADGWHVLMKDGRDLQARCVINAAGAWADEIAKLAGLAPIGIKAYRRSMAVLPAPGGLDTSEWAFASEVHERWYAKPQSGKLIVSPEEEDELPPHDVWADDMVLAEGLSRYEALVTEPVTRVEANWAGLRTFAPDRALVLGRDPSEPSFIWCAGQGGYGFQTAPAAARLIGAIAAEHASELGESITQALSPARFAQ